MTTILVSVGINLVLLGFFYILLSKKAAQPKQSAEFLEQIRTELDEMVVELNRTADRNIGLVEERIRSLNRLIGEADRRVSILKKETDKYTRSAGTYSNVRPIHIDPGKAYGQKSIEQVEVENKEKKKEDGKPDLPDKALLNKDHSGKEAPSKRERVMELYRQGISPEIIASRLESTVGEVELIISMTGADR